MSKKKKRKIKELVERLTALEAIVEDTINILNRDYQRQQLLKNIKTMEPKIERAH